MKILHRFILVSFISPLLATFFIVMFVLTLQFLWLYIDDLVGKGLDTAVIAELILYASINLIPMALPLSMLLASIMTMGNLGEHNELQVLTSLGVSLFRIMLPIFIISLLLTASSFLFSNNILPYTNLKLTSLLFSVKQQRPELQIKPGIFYNGIEGYIIKIDGKDEGTGLLHDIIIYDHSKSDGNKSLTIADSGYLRITKNQQYLIFTLYNGIMYEDVKENNAATPTYPLRTHRFEEQENIFELIGYGFERSDENLFKNRSAMLNLQQLTEATDSMMAEREKNAQQQFNAFFHSSPFSHSYEFEQPDSIHRKIYPCVLTKDSLLRQLNMEQIARAAAGALQRALEAKSALTAQTESLQYDNRNINNNNIQWHLKFTYPVACLIFFLIGAPLGAIIRKGGFGTSFVISLLFFLVYYVISISCQKIARDGLLETSAAMWTASLLTLPLGIFLTYKAAKDSHFTLSEKHLKIIQNILKFIFIFMRK